MQTLSSLLIWLLVILLGMSVGAGLYESRVVVPLWAQTPPETWVNTGKAFWAFVTSGPLTLVMLVSLLVIWKYDGPSRPWWLAALGVVILERIATFGFFIPTMIEMQQQTGASAEVSLTLATWSRLNHGRHLLSAAAWLLSLRALSLLSAERASGPPSSTRRFTGFAKKSLTPRRR